jgi:UDP-3-O-acyl-N-acetylglucosamine deacetylase
LPPAPRWYDQEMVRFINDEPIRRAVVDLVGDLALLNDCGNGGMPVGHVVAYRPTHDLQVGLLVGACLLSGRM